MRSGTWSPNAPGGDARFALTHAALFLVVVWAPLGIWAAWDARRAGAASVGQVLLASAIDVRLRSNNT